MAGVAKYSIEIKPAAGKELDALDNALFARIDRKTWRDGGHAQKTITCS
jgi:hypothetical protein